MNIIVFFIVDAAHLKEFYILLTFLSVCVYMQLLAKLTSTVLLSVAIYGHGDNKPLKQPKI